MSDEKKLQLLKAQEALEAAYKQHPLRHDRLGQFIQQWVEKTGVRQGRLLEIGGRKNSYGGFLKVERYENLDLSKTDDSTVVADITHCPELPSESYDIIISVDVFEHINRPWKAAEEIIRLLKPGGMTCHSTLFSWRYHPCPIDYWRFTPEALKFLFEGLEHQHAAFDLTERRRNIIGRDKNRLEPDAFGGWRENWRVNYVGVKRA